jgi:hypothetical protein
VLLQFTLILSGKKIIYKLKNNYKTPRSEKDLLAAVVVLSATLSYAQTPANDDVVGISNRMLSKELKELEINQLVKRTVLDTQPITVQYELTEHGNTLQTIISNLSDWGIAHRKKIVGK